MLEISPLDIESDGFDHRNPRRPTRPKAPTLIVRVPLCHLSWLMTRCRPLAVLLVLCALAASASGSSGVSPDRAEHSKVCHCGVKCRGASCCCGSPRASAPPQVKPVGPTRTIVSENPCWNSSPCQDPFLPRSAPPGSSEKFASSSSPELRPTGLGPRLAPSHSTEFPMDRRSSRLDRPPRDLAFA